ncbi:tripartite tricarboxylate transporter TctB family protein [Roseibium sp. MMSF_3544]|uniref:tripartite tricarboxylate transporter TctB family protein n=1 Tax=unclassified Roseibium TaxID=2629323 RepID=UPI00273DAAB0|nr:tripartite tricarboxylate transporter TctB family protein [Roseibium sp. MMSF_3544]
MQDSLVTSLLGRMSAYAWFSLLNIFLAALMLALVPSQVDKPPALFGMDSEGLNPEFFPQVVTVLWLMASLWTFVDAISHPSEQTSVSIDLSALLRVLVTLGAALAYTLLLVPLGFVASSAAVIIVLSLFLGARSPLKIGFTAIVVPSAVFFIFTRLLTVSLPPFPFQIFGG